MPISLLEGTLQDLRAIASVYLLVTILVVVEVWLFCMGLSHGRGFEV